MMQEDNAKRSTLLALFNSLDEQDKNIIIQLSESLNTKNKQNMTENVNDDKSNVTNKEIFI
jgi:hypothetical protein